jgi:hypothetical protein
MHPGMAARFSLDEGATLNIELTADIGKGYQPAVANRPAPSTACQGRRSGQAKRQSG